jgi:photosystem II stability/assembly factor-like uncharacterized protein
MVAVDNVCAWPNLTVLQDGAIAAAIFNQPSHGGMEGDVECWVTRDGGLTWRRAGIAAPHEPATNRMNVAAGRARNGDLIVIASGWSNRYPAGSSGPAFRAAVLAPWLCRSADGGRRWSIDRSGLPERAPDGHRWIPYGDIVQADDGALRTAVYSWPEAGPRNERAWCIESVDDGKTWGRFRPLDRDQLRNETALLNLGRRKWLSVARQSALYGYASDDGGKSWRTLGPITDKGQHPAHLLQLQDNRVLLSYGDRTGSKHAVQVVVSSDEGNTWSAPLRVVDWWGDGGYPSSVQRPDGQVVTAYYAARTAGHERYHMGVVIWDPVRSLGVAR